MKRIVSIIVNYNSGPFLSNCVKSLRTSRFGDEIEHLIYVVDNASSDDSLEKLDITNDASLKLQRNEKNIGFSAANNQGFRDIAADYYACVNPDCVVGEDTLTHVIDAMESDTSVAIASCIIHNIDGTVQKTCKRKFPTPGSAFSRMFGLDRVDPQRFPDFDQGNISSDSPPDGSTIEYVEAISGAFFVVRKNALKEIGLLDEGYFMHCEDLDYCMRARLAGYHVGFLNNTSVTHSKGGSSEQEKVRVLWYLHKGMARFYKKFYQDEYPFIVSVLVYLGIAIRFTAKSCQAVFLKLFTFPRPVNG